MRELGALQLDPDHQPSTAYLADQLMTCLQLGDPIQKQSARASRMLDQAIALDHPQRRKPGRHRQTVAAERRLVDVGTFERPDCPLEDVTGGDHRSDRHVAAAERLAHQDHVRLESRPLEREPSSRPSQAGLDLVDDEQRPVAPAQRLGRLEVAGGRQRDHPPLDRLDDERGDVPGAQFRLQAREIAERHPRAAGQQRTEALLEELVTDDRQWPERDAMEAAVA